MSTDASELTWIDASVPVAAPPAWAVLERALFRLLDDAAQEYAQRYADHSGALRFAGRLPDRDGVDDFYEAFYSFPLLYLLGGCDELLAAGHRHFDGVTAQLTELGYLVDEFERGYDWFHQGESLLFLYLLSVADPDHARTADRVRRFAELYVDPRYGNYDPARNVIRAPHNGACGARWGLDDGPPSFPWRAGMARHGLPLDDVPGVGDYDDLRDPAAARDMGQAMADRMGRGDIAVNLAATSLVTLAYLGSGERRLADWVLAYVDGWLARARDNGGLVPDNVGLSGRVGEYHSGRWYGGHYGWNWPHGLLSVGSAVLIGGANALLLTGDDGYLDLARTACDEAFGRRIRASIAQTEMSQTEHWLDQFDPAEAEQPILLVPHRVGARGWFDYQPMWTAFPTTIWHLSGNDGDLRRLLALRAESGYDWSKVRHFRNKEETGHDEPWLAYLLGDYPDYPADALAAAIGQVSRRLAMIGADQEPPVDIHLWQELNPVTTEVLVQLTTGSPSPLYNGGLPYLRVRYFDAEAGRPGLPPDVAALVTRADRESVALELINLSASATRAVLVQAGTFAEDQIGSVRASRLAAAGWPGSRKSYRLPPAAQDHVEVAVGAPRVGVRLPPLTTISLHLAIERRANPPRLCSVTR